MEKQKFLVTVYANKRMPELSIEQGIALSDTLEKFFKSCMPKAEVFDAGIDKVSNDINAKSIEMFLSL